MSKCDMCGTELKWVGSMRDGKLECQFCKIFDNLPLEPSEREVPQFVNAVPGRFVWNDTKSGLVVCPSCGALHYFATLPFDQTTNSAYCNLCDTWSVSAL